MSSFPSNNQTRNSVASVAVNQSDFNPYVDEQGPLPAGWERRLDQVGRIYYVVCYSKRFMGLFFFQF